MDKKGAIYKANLNIAMGKNRNILYDINKIERIDGGAVPSTAKRKGLARNINSFNGSVSQAKDDVKTRFSLKTDSEGNQLSQEQAEYFEDSKVRDGDGKSHQQT